MNKRRKVFRKVFLTLLCCLVLGSSVVACNKEEETTKKSDSKKESKSKKKGRFITVSEKGVIEDAQTEEGVVTVILNNGDTITLEMSTYDSYRRDYSQDGSVAFFFNDEGAFFIIKDGKVIEDELAAPEANMVISTYGDTVAYFTDVEFHSRGGYQVGKLNLYDTKEKKVTVITEEAITENVKLSPDGKTVAYTAPDKEEEYWYAAYCSVNGKEPFEIENQAYCMAIADDAKYIYYSYEEDDKALYVKTGEDGEELLLTDEFYFCVYVNADASEVLFSEDGDIYISVNGTESQYLGEGEIDDLVFSNDAARYYEGDAMYTGISSFAGTAICTYDDVLYYIASEYQMLEIDAGVNDCIMSEDGKTMVYIDSYGDVCRWDSSDPEKPSLLCEGFGAEYVWGAGNLKNVYFTVEMEEYDELYYIGEDGPELLAEDVTDVEVSSEEEYCYYVVDESEAFVFKGKGEAESIYTSKYDCEMWKSGEVILVGDEGDDQYDLYRAAGDKVKEVCTVEW